jgi:hypothetical protein
VSGHGATWLSPASARAGGIERPADICDTKGGPVQDVPAVALPKPVDLRGDRRPVHQEPERPADKGSLRIGWRVGARPFAVHLAPGIGEVQQVCSDLRGRRHEQPAPTTRPVGSRPRLDPRFQACRSRRSDGRGRGNGITATLQLQRVEEGAAGDVVVGFSSARSPSAGRNSTHRYGPVPTGRWLAGPRVRRTGRIRAGADLPGAIPQNACPNAVGSRTRRGPHDRRAARRAQVPVAPAHAASIAYPR